MEAAESGADQGEAAWAALAPEELRAHLVDAVRGLVAAEMKWAPDSFDVRRPLMEMGLDSVMTLRHPAPPGEAVPPRPARHPPVGPPHGDRHR